MLKLLRLPALIACLLCSFAHAGEASLDERFVSARNAFDKGEFAKAQHEAEAIMKDGHLSREVMELLGHARYRLGDMGRAALWYRRAALFPPPSPELRQNLAHIHERTGNFSFPANGLLDQLSAWLTRDHWLRLAWICGWTIVFSILLCVLYLRSNALRVLLLTGAAAAMLVGTIALIGWVCHPTYETLKDVGIITAPSTLAYAAASTTASSLGELRAGSEIRTLQERGAWCYVEFPSSIENRRGWVQKNALTPLWPYDPAYLR